MNPDGGSEPSVAAVRTAIADADVGASILTADLVTMGAIGSGTTVDPDGAVTVEVTVPVPSEAVRRELEAAVTATVSSLPGVTAVAVRWRTVVPAYPGQVDLLPDVKNVIAIASGKGGVGKSTVAANLATALADAGASVGLLDADVYGPNAPTILGLPEATPSVTAEGGMVPPEMNGVAVLSMAHLVDEDDPIIWRGVLVDEVLTQLVADGQWGERDYLIVDLPPGTGDAQLSIVQHLPVAGAVMVTTPQDTAVADTRRGLEGFVTHEVPILGIVENMAAFVCPDCGSRHRPFDVGGAAMLADAFDVPVLGTLPLDPTIGRVERTADRRPKGVSLPGIGRVGLPRTKTERAGHEPLVPIATRAPASDAGEAFRRTAARLAARLNVLINDRLPANEE